MKNKKIYSLLILFTVCIVTAFSFLKGSAVSSQKNEIKTNPDTEYQITYELNGGQFEGEYPKTFKISQETSIPNPTKEGSEFLGWTINDKTDVSPIKDYTIPKMTKENVKLTANWKSKDNMLVDGQTFNSKINAMPNFDQVVEIRFIYGTPNPNGVDVSQSQDKSIMASIEGNVLTVASEGEILANPDCSNMFLKFGRTDTSSINQVLNKITFDNFNTSKVTTMEGMFMWCSSLEILNVSGFNTSQVTNMGSIFNDCNKLTEIVGLEKWDTSKVTDMSGMFSYLYNLTETLGLENWDTSNVTNMYYMFYRCYNLNGEITIMNSNITNYFWMFKDCSTDPSTKFVVKYKDKATKEIARQMVATKSTNSNVFLYEEPSTLVDGQTFNSTIKAIPNFVNVTDIKFIQDTPNPNGVDVSQAQDKSIMANIEGNVLTVACEDEIMANLDSSFMLDSLLNIKNIIFTNFDTSKVKNMNYMFNGCKVLTSLDLRNFDISQVTYMSSMFYGCKSLTNIVGLENFNTSNVIGMINMFTYCWNLNGEITIMNPNIIHYASMFYDCSSSSGRFLVNYASGCMAVAQSMIETKTPESQIVLGTQKSLLNEDVPNEEEPSVLDTVVLTIKDGNKTTIKEILAGEIGSLNAPSKEGMIFSGYFYDEEFTKPVSERDVISEDTTIYIKWEEVPQIEENPQEEAITPQEENKDESLEVA